MLTEAAARKLALPRESEWVSVDIPEVYASFSDGSSFSAPAHVMQIASRYPTFEDGELVANVTQAQAAKFLRDYNEANGTKFRYPMLFEDEAIRDRLGRYHALFDENFQRNAPWRWGYVADYNKPYGQTQEGVNGQPLVTRLVGFRLPDGDYEIGPVTIAPSGMVPTLSRDQLEKMIGAKGLKRLEQLRGKDIYEKVDAAVDVRNAIGYPQFTLDHDARDEGKLLSHSHHVYTPGQNEPERVGVRSAGWGHPDELWCFDVYLYANADHSDSYRSAPLVRGGSLEAEVTRPSYKIAL